MITLDPEKLRQYGVSPEQAISAVQKNTRLRKARLEEKLFTLVQTQLEFLAPHERFTRAGPQSGRRSRGAV